MQLFGNIKRGLKAAAVTALSAYMAFAPVTSAWAANASGDEVVGNLCIAALYTKGEDDTSISALTDGHSYVVFTSYKDGLDLNFTDLYGYYEMTDEFKAATEQDDSQLTWRAQFEEAAKKVGSNVTLEKYEAVDEDSRESTYPELYKAIYEAGDACFTGEKANENHDEAPFYNKTSYNCTLDSGEYVTVGDYTFSSRAELAKSAFLNSTLKDEIAEILEKHLIGEDAQKEIAKELEDLVQQYYEGKLDDEGFRKAILDLIESKAKGAYDDFVALIGGDYKNLLKMIDGDGKGGVFVNRELWRQKVYQTLDPNKIYSIDITQSQLDRMMAYVNGENGVSENHYSATAHNCTTFSVGAWNAAVGTDANGSQTSLYLNALDDTYEALSGIFATPKKVCSVISSWDGQGLGGTVMTDVRPIRGVKAPTYTVSFDSAGGSTVSPIEVQVGKAVTEPDAPTREGYTFKGWTLNGEAYDFSAPVTGDLELVASWEALPVNYTVTFDSDGGSAVDAQTVKSGECATKPADPTREGYTFKGWTLDGEAYDFSTPVTSDIALKASWEKNVAPKPKDKPKKALPQTGDQSLAIVAGLAVAGVAAIAIGHRRLS